MTTNEKIAELILKQTYEERYEMAEFLEGHSDVASLLFCWAQDNLPVSNPI